MNDETQAGGIDTRLPIGFDPCLPADNQHIDDDIEREEPKEAIDSEEDQDEKPN